MAPPALGGAVGLCAGAMGIGAVAVAVSGIETRRRRLEDIVAKPVGVATVAA